MSRDDFIRAVAAILGAAGLPNPLFEAARFLLDNPGMETDLIPEAAAAEWLIAAGDDFWKDPARYGAS